MARTARPWFRTERAEWCVNIRGEFHILGPHPEGYPRPSKTKGKWNAPKPILDRFHELMAGTRTTGGVAAHTVRQSEGLAIADVMEKYLGWCKRERSPRTYEWYTNHLQSFVESLNDPKNTPAEQLRPFHIDEWLKDKSTWGPAHRRGGIIAVQRAFSWAEDMGYIFKSPIRKVAKPAPVRREQILTIDEFRELLSTVKDQCFRDVLEFCWESGCRVQEVRLIEAAHYEPANGRIEIPPEQAKGKKRWRYIYLTPAAEAIIKRLSLKQPDGPIFRNLTGNAWDAQAFNNRFCRFQLQMGRQELDRTGFKLDEKRVKKFAATLRREKTVHGRNVAKTEAELLSEARFKLTNREAAKHGVKYALTTIRHSYATRMLEAGCDHLTVSSLLGHVDGTMLAKVYQHLGQKTDYLRQQLLRVSNAQNAA